MHHHLRLTEVMQIDSMIERRVLLNYRLDPEMAGRLLPKPLRPQLVRGSAVAGTCFIRLGQARPIGLPTTLGWRMENAAHRIAVEWDGPDGIRRGVYLPKQFTESKISALAGRLMSPGPQQLGKFFIQETESEFDLSMRSSANFARARACRTDSWHSELFGSHRESSDFFEASPVGWSSRQKSGSLTGVRLSTRYWSTSPLQIDELESSYFAALPTGAAVFDHALLMQQIPASWSVATLPEHSAIRFDTRT